jgi:hypothetical protein
LVDSDGALTTFCKVHNFSGTQIAGRAVFVPFHAAEDLFSEPDEVWEMFDRDQALD